MLEQVIEVGTTNHFLVDVNAQFELDLLPSPPMSTLDLVYLLCANTALAKLSFLSQKITSRPKVCLREGELTKPSRECPADNYNFSCKVSMSF